MQNVYLLLRSNKQTGPYSLEELLQLNLKPFDLVWVEGRSAAWQYPFEIPALKPFVPETPQAEVPFQPVATSAMEENIFQTSDPNPDSEPQNPIPKKTDVPKRVFVSIPKTYNPAKEQKTFAEQNSFTPKSQPVYERKEEVKPVASYSQPTQPSYQQQKPVEEEVRTNYSRSLNEVEEEYTNWAYKQKTKKRSSVNPKDLVLATLILAVIGGGYYVMSKPSVANSVLPANKTAAQTYQQSTEMNSKEAGSRETILPEPKTAAAKDIVNKNEATKPSKNIKTKNPETVSKSQTNSSVPQVQNSMPVEKTTPNIHDDNNTVVLKPEVKQQPKETVPTEKKKKFGDVIKGIFSKKEKKEEPKNEETVLEDPKPASNRQATRRETNDNPDDDNAGSNEISTASLMEQIDISSNAPDNWMMGVRNLKVTLRNRNNVTLQTASVAVNYYDENNQLLEKKLIYFNNVAPKSKATVVAPDHKFADHVDFRLTSVSPKEDRYAKY